MTLTRPNLVTLDPDALAQNLRLISGLLPEGVEIYQVCKGDGYGLGTVQAAQLGVASGLRAFCVGTPQEALDLRDTLPEVTILLFPGTAPADFPALVASDITLTVHNEASLDAVLTTTPEACFELKVNTGLHRYGFDRATWLRALERIAAAGLAGLTGIYTHISQSRDAAGLATSITEYQWFLDRAEEQLGWRPPSMAAASPVLMTHPGLRFDRVDPGRALYGMLKADEAGGHVLRPVVRSVTSVLLDSHTLSQGERVQLGYGGADHGPVTRVGTMPIGHFDGLPASGPLGTVFIRGQEVRVLARTLLSSLLDLSALPEARDGDEIVLIGTSGTQARDIFACAASLGTNATMLHFGLIRNLSMHQR